jgi:hypothetical protein
MAEEKRDPKEKNDEVRRFLRFSLTSAMRDQAAQKKTDWK